ncbi:MAG: hypothetical protein QOE86_527 [Solirubrobacteraceae bacterium]|jgi:signal transduction histidine kinase|nr:hypothetical protein [Solirubrobacteraceae bacterium]
MRVPRVDVALALAACAGGVWLMLANVGFDGVDVGPAAAPAILLVTLPMLWRSLAPLAALAAVTAGLLVHVIVFGTVVRCGIVLPVTWLLAFAVGARLPQREARLGLGIAVVAQLLMGLADGALNVGIAAALSPITIVLWATGRVVHARGMLVAELEERTAELRRARDERARLEVATDRARLSTQLDAVLKDRLADLAALADRGAGEDDDTARAILVEIETVSRSTLEDMRAVVGVLRDDDVAPTAPQPTLVHLEALLMRAKGTSARLRIEGSPRVLPVGVELSAYRVVEHLLGALEDAGAVEVRVRFGDDALDLAVTGPARRRAAAAFDRARERVELHHGTLVASTEGGRAEAVARLPILAGV